MFCLLQLKTCTAELHLKHLKWSWGKITCVLGIWDNLVSEEDGALTVGGCFTCTTPPSRGDRIHYNLTVFLIIVVLYGLYFLTKICKFDWFLVSLLPMAVNHQKHKSKCPQFPEFYIHKQNIQSNCCKMNVVPKVSR